jgi:hypothetical protein
MNIGVEPFQMISLKGKDLNRRNLKMQNDTKKDQMKSLLP